MFLVLDICWGPSQRVEPMKSTISFGHRQSTRVPGGLNVTRSLGDLDAHLECGIASFPEVQLGQQRQGIPSGKLT